MGKRQKKKGYAWEIQLWEARAVTRPVVEHASNLQDPEMVPSTVNEKFDVENKYKVPLFTGLALGLGNNKDKNRKTFFKCLVFVLKVDKGGLCSSLLFSKPAL